MPGDQPDAPCSSTTGLHCEIYGRSGEPVLAVHGLGASVYSWRKLKGRLPEHTLIMVDLRGHGDSPKPDDKHYSIQEQAELVHQFILEHDLKNLTLMGNSYGGAVSLLLAIRLCKEDPGRLSKLILIDSGGYNQDLPWHLKLLRTPVLGWLALYLGPPKLNALIVLLYGYSKKRRITWEQVKAYARPLSLPGGRHGLLETAKQALPDNIEEITSRYPTISVPTLILWGRDDKVIPLSIGEKLKQAIADSRLLLIEQAGHVPQEEEPEETIGPILKFLKDPNSVP